MSHLPTLRSLRLGTVSSHLWNLRKAESRCLQICLRWTVKNLSEGEHKAWMTDLETAFQVGIMTGEHKKESVQEDGGSETGRREGWRRKGMLMSGAKRDAKWLCQRAAWRTKHDDDATESGGENSCKRRDWSEKNSHYSLVAGIATIPKPFFLRKKRQF